MQFFQSKNALKFFAIVFASLAIAAGPGRYLLSFAYHTGDQSYILLIPVLTAMLIYRDQDAIFRHVVPGPSVQAITALVVGIAFIGVAYILQPASEWQMVATGLGLTACWVGAFAYCFGFASARAAAFPLAMLLWVIPIPSAIVESFRYFLQLQSANLTNVMFNWTGLPVLREGLFIFHLPTQSIEVASECSGIRSSLCLIVLTLVIAHETLRGNFRRFILVLLTVPIVVMKNGVRIVTLTLGAIYVDPSFLTGPLHHDGGIVFFLIGMAMLIPVIALLKRGDRKSESGTSSASVRGAAAQS